MNRIIARCTVLSAVCLWGYGATAVAETIHYGNVYRNGSLSTIGFPDFLDQTNATTRAANFFGTAETLNSVSVQACPTTGIPGFVTFSGVSTLTTALDWVNDSQRAAKNAISGTGVWTTTWSMSIAATANQAYHVELLSCAIAGSASNRTFSVDLSLDGGTTYTRYATDLFVPGINGAASSVYEFDVTAGSQGIALKFSLGTSEAYVHPWLNAMSITGVSIPEPGTIFLLAAGVLGLIACAWRRRK